MLSLYTEENYLRIKKRASALTIFLISLTVLSLAAAVGLCFFVRTENASALLLAIIIETTLSGWISILVLNLFCLPAVREKKHMEHIFKEKPVILEGELHVSALIFPIPKSIEIQKAALRTDDEEIFLSVNRRYTPLLPKNGAVVQVLSVSGYITGIEVKQ